MSLQEVRLLEGPNIVEIMSLNLSFDAPYMIEKE